MHYINGNLYRARGLDDSKIEFFQKIVPFGKSVSQFTIIKAHDREVPIETQHGIFPSVVIAFCIFRSNWGTHPVSQPRIEGEIGEDGKRKWSHGNNFALVPADKYWLDRKNPTIKFDDTLYKSYRSEANAAVDLSDVFSLRYNWNRALLATDVFQQLIAMSRRAKDPIYFSTVMWNAIKEWELQKFDSN